MKNTLETRLGIFVALIVIAAVLIVEIVGGIEKFKRGYRVHALFNSVQELKIGDRVKMAGVEVGRVEAITLTTNKVKVTMKLRANATVTTSSIAAIRFAGLMGQNFVSLDFGTNGAPRIANDTILDTIEQPDLGVIMQKLDSAAAGVENLTKSFTGVKIDVLLAPLVDTIKDSRESLTNAAANLSAISSQIAKGEGTIGKLIYDDALYNTAITTVSNLQSTSDEIKLTLANARKIIDGVNAGEGSLGKLVKDEKLYTETTASMTNLKEILQKINQGDGTVGKLVNDQEFYKNAKLSLQKLDKMTEGLEDSGPLSVMGTLMNSLF